MKAGVLECWYAALIWLWYLLWDERYEKRVRVARMYGASNQRIWDMLREETREDSRRDTA